MAEPGAGVEQQARALVDVVGDSATHEVFPPTRLDSRPAAGIEPAHATEIDAHQLARLLLPPVAGRPATASWSRSELGGGDGGGPNGGHGAQRGGAVAAFQGGPLAEDGARSDLGPARARRPRPPATPSSTRKISSAASPCVVSTAPAAS